MKLCKLKKGGYTYSWMKGNWKEKFCEDEKDLVCFTLCRSTQKRIREAENEIERAGGGDGRL